MEAPEVKFVLTNYCCANFTAVFAASSASFKIVTGNPDSSKIFLAAAELVPSNLMTRGCLGGFSLHAATMPLAIVAQLTIPGK